MSWKRRTYEFNDVRDEVERKAFYEWLDRLAASDAFDVTEVSIRLQVIHEPTRPAKPAPSGEAGERGR